MKKIKNKTLYKMPSKRDWQRLDMKSRLEDIESSDLLHTANSWGNHGPDYMAAGREILSSYDKMSKKLSDFDKKYGYTGQKLKAWNNRMYKADGYYESKKSNKKSNKKEK